MGSAQGIITSFRNPRVKAARALRQRKHRAASGLFLVEGIRLVGDALKSGFKIQSVFYAPDLLTSLFARGLVAEARQRGIETLALSAEVFASLAEREHPQGILATARWPRRTLEEISPAQVRWAAALLSPQDPGNIGTILRTLDAVGADALFLLERPADPTHPAAVRASMGTLFWVPVVQASFAEFAAWSRRHARRVYGTSAHAEGGLEILRQAERPCILLLGSERTGLTPEQQAICEASVRLPMRGHVSSLNLGVAAGICLYAMLEGETLARG